MSKTSFSTKKLSIKYLITFQFCSQSFKQFCAGTKCIFYKLIHTNNLNTIKASEYCYLRYVRKPSIQRSITLDCEFLIVIVPPTPPHLLPLRSLRHIFFQAAQENYLKRPMLALHKKLDGLREFFFFLFVVNFLVELTL